MTHLPAEALWWEWYPIDKKVPSMGVGRIWWGGTDQVPVPITLTGIIKKEVVVLSTTAPAMISCSYRTFCRILLAIVAFGLYALVEWIVVRRP